MSDGNNLIVRPYIPNNELRGNLDNYREKFKKCLTYELYCSFWLLNLDCVFYPHKIYEEKIEELKVLRHLLRKKSQVGEITTRIRRNSRGLKPSTTKLLRNQRAKTRNSRKP